MGKLKIFSATVLMLLAVVTIASAQCACSDSVFGPGKFVTMGKNFSICDVATCSGIACDVFAKCLKKFQARFKDIAIDVNKLDSGQTFRIPFQWEIDVVQKETGGQTPQISKSKHWIKKFVSKFVHDKFLQESYTVQSGDDIFIIAKKYKKNPQVLVSFSHLSNPEHLRVGQLIDIPDTSYKYWMIEDAAPYGSTPQEDALAACDFPDTVKSGLLELMNSNAYRDSDYIKDGQVLRMMFSAPLNVRGKRIINGEKRVVACFNHGLAYHAKSLRFTLGDSVYVYAVPDVCQNPSTWVENLPPQKLEPPPAPPCPPCPSCPKPDSTPHSDAPPADSTPQASAPPDSGIPPLDSTTISNRNQLTLWGGLYSPYPYMTDLMEYLGGRFAEFFPTADGAIFAFGLNATVNSWNGFGPRPQRFRFAGVRPGAGVVFDWLNDKSRFDIYLDYAGQFDWGWDGSNIVDSSQYHGRQISQLFNPSLAGISTTDPDWKWWISWWVDAQLDLNDVGSGFDHKLSDVGGRRLYQYQDPLEDKSSLNLGLDVFYWDISTPKTSLVLGSGAKSSHLWGDNRYEVELDQLLDIDHWWQVVVGAKDTRDSKYRDQNGWSVILGFNMSLLDIGKYKRPAPVQSVW